jgi:SAM-dependent methyltransferase
MLEKSGFKRAIPGSVRRAARFFLDAINAFVTLTVRTHKRRWRKVSMDPNPHWDDRNKVIAALIPDGSSVLDLGCGAQTLRRHLKPGCKYQPCDVIKSSPDVILCDFNEGIYPVIAGEFDYVVCSGVFEYIRNPRKFLQKASSFGRKLILSYNPLLPEKSKFSRLAVNWNNHLTREETERLFDDVPLVWEVLRIKEEDGEIIYSLHIADKTAARGGVMEIPVTENKCS